ncbi:MAG TPA: ribonuclease J [Anaeromyxobacteraceae bacterium]|nr:ribonuclease J [Anaeromyxobacteraceae bacterium]
MAPPVRIAALGGLGEVGMNCMAVECEGRIAVVDCGLLFPDEPLGVDVVLPDLSWLRERAAQVGAVYLTHGHEDHVGALPVLLRDLRVPVFGPRFALALLRRRLEEAGVEADLREVAPGDVRPAGEGSPLAAEFLAVAHSIPDACGLALSTPQGTLLHSGDFKIDDRPVAGPPTDLARIEALGRSGVRLLLSDSTNAERPGRSPSESSVREGLDAAFDRVPGRVLVACFASNVHRIQQVADAARATGRRLAPMGRAMEENVRLALSLGYLSFPPWQLCSLAEVRQAPPAESCVLVSGTQGEPRSALARLARGEHPELSIRPGDRVIFSSRLIPGNERALHQVMNDLARAGAEVLHEQEPPLHATGHAHEEEQRQLIRLARPGAFLPIHGEYRQLARHAAHAAAEGVATRLLASDGDVVEIADSGIRVAAGEVPAGRVYADRDALGRDVAEMVVRGRRLLAEAGLVLCVLAVDRGTGAVVRGPELFAVGVAGFDGAADAIRAEALAALAEMSGPAREDAAEVQEVLRAAVRRWFRREGLRRPAVLPVVLEL